LTLTTTTTSPFNTDTSSTCVATTSSAAGYCVLAGTTITVDCAEGPTLRATGSKPLVLVASDSIPVKTILDVSSHHTTNPTLNPETGAGANFSGCAAPVANPGNGGGGAGGSFNGAGGSGAASARGGSSGGSSMQQVATAEQPATD
jgi:hypothetical protein